MSLWDAKVQRVSVVMGLANADVYMWRAIAALPRSVQSDPRWDRCASDAAGIWTVLKESDSCHILGSSAQASLIS